MYSKRVRIYEFFNIWTQAQIVLLIILLVAIVDFLIGAFIGPLDSEEISKGYVGFNGMSHNLNFKDCTPLGVHQI